MNTLQGIKHGELVEVRDTTVAQDVMLRVWGNTESLHSDSRMSPDQARILAANLLQAAQICDGQRISFFYHDEDCSPVAQANGLCCCSGEYNGS